MFIQAGMALGIFVTIAPLLRLLWPHVIQSDLCDSGKRVPRLFEILADPGSKGKGKSAKEVLKRIDYGGSLFLLMTVIVLFSVVICIVLTQCTGRLDPFVFKCSI